MHETQIVTPSKSWFLTLTYNPAHLPPNGALQRDDLTKFLKRFRKANGPVRYLACGEYGDFNLRPHYHLAFWGHSFDDRRAWKRTPKGHTLYRSATLERAWRCPKCKEPIGHAWIGALTFESAAYVAGYVTKKLTGAKGWEAHLRAIEEPGQPPRLVSVPSEFAVMSRGRREAGDGGLGYRFYRRYRSDLFPKDYVNVQKGNGVRKFPVPRYYRKLLELEDPELAQDLRERRQSAALSRAVEDSPELRRARDATLRGERALYGHPDSDGGARGLVADRLAWHLRVKQTLGDHLVVPEWRATYGTSDRTDDL